MFCDVRVVLAVQGFSLSQKAMRPGKSRYIQQYVFYTPIHFHVCMTKCTTIKQVHVAVFVQGLCHPVSWQLQFNPHNHSLENRKRELRRAHFLNSMDNNGEHAKKKSLKRSTACLCCRLQLPCQCENHD